MRSYFDRQSFHSRSLRPATVRRIQWSAQRLPMVASREQRAPEHLLDEMVTRVLTRMFRTPLRDHLERERVAGRVGKIVPLRGVPMPALLHADHRLSDVFRFEPLPDRELVTQQRREHVCAPRHVEDRMPIALTTIPEHEPLRFLRDALLGNINRLEPVELHPWVLHELD